MTGLRFREAARQLQQRGFGALRLTQDEKMGLERAVAEFKSRGVFRFPSVEEESTVYSAAAKTGFNVLYAIAAHTGAAIADEVRIHTGIEVDLVTEENTLALPAFAEGEDTPFTGAGSSRAYIHSFFNIFNYNHGTLNAHRDRCLVTAVYGSSSRSTQATHLWAQTNDQTWIDLDETVDSNHLVLFTGEDLQDMTDGYFSAILHACRVDPTGPFLAHSFENRDPDAAPTGNRQSLALVLSS